MVCNSPYIYREHEVVYHIVPLSSLKLLDPWTCWYPLLNPFHYLSHLACNEKQGEWFFCCWPCANELESHDLFSLYTSNINHQLYWFHCFMESSIHGKFHCFIDSIRSTQWKQIVTFQFLLTQGKPIKKICVWYRWETGRRQKNLLCNLGWDKLYFHCNWIF